MTTGISPTKASRRAVSAHEAVQCAVREGKRARVQLRRLRWEGFGPQRPNQFTSRAFLMGRVRVFAEGRLQPYFDDHCPHILMTCTPSADDPANTAVARLEGLMGWLADPSVPERYRFAGLHWRDYAVAELWFRTVVIHNVLDDVEVTYA